MKYALFTFNLENLTHYRIVSHRHCLWRLTPCDTVIIWANKTSRRCFWRHCHWPRGLTRQWSVIKTWKRLALACGKQIGVHGPGKAWAHARSKQTPHCNFPSLKRHLHTSHTALQCNSDFKAFENVPLTNLPDVCSTMITRGLK